MVTLFGAVVVVLGMSAANAFPSDAEKRQDASRIPSCPSDDSTILNVTGTFKMSRANCTCTYAGDKKGQDGPNSDTAWYKNKKCEHPSFAGLVLNRGDRTLWEIECQCDEVAKEEPACLLSYLGGQWMRCAIIVFGQEDPDKVCTQINYLDGSTGHSQAHCNIAGDYYWGK